MEGEKGTSRCLRASAQGSGGEERRRKRHNTIWCKEGKALKGVIHGHRPGRPMKRRERGGGEKDAEIE